MHSFRHHISLILLIFFSIVLIPGEYIHLLYNHRDTECHPGKSAVFDKIHKHCKLLQYKFSNFSNLFVSIQGSFRFVFKIFRLPAKECVLQNIQRVFSTRAPPAQPEFSQAGSQYFSQNFSI